MSVIVPSGAADAADLLSAFYDMWRNSGYSNVSKGTQSQVAISKDFASLIIKRPPASAPSVPRSDPAYQSWASAPTTAANQIVAVFKATVPGSAGGTGNLSDIFTAGKRVSLGGSGTHHVAVEWVSGKVAISADGVTWTPAGTFLGGRSYQPHIAWTGSTFVLVEARTAWNDYSNKVWVSSDFGVTWTAKTIPAAAGYSAGAADGEPASNGAGVVVIPYIVPGINHYAMSVSTDSGNSWSTLAPRGQFGPKVVWSGSLFYTQTSTLQFDGQDGAATSAGGVSWVAKPIPDAYFSSADLAAHNSIFYAVCAYGGSFHPNPSIAVSLDAGTSWVVTDITTSVITDIGNAAYRHLAAYGAGMMLIVRDADAVGSNVYITSADNGVTWTARTLPLSTVWNALVWTGSMFLLAGKNGACYRSSNGIDWDNIAADLPEVVITQQDINIFTATLPSDAPSFYIVGSPNDPNYNPASPFTTLAKGSFIEATAPPLPMDAGGAFMEITAPPLPIEAGGSFVECSSPVSLPLADISAGGLVQCIGVPFSLGG